MIVKGLLNVLIIGQWSGKNVYDYICFPHVDQHVVLKYLQIIDVVENLQKVTLASRKHRIQPLDLL